MRIRRHIADDEQLRRMIAQTRDLCRASTQILAEPRPDTFLGRKTREQISREGDPDDSPVKVDSHLRGSRG